MRGILIPASGFLGNTIEAWAHGQSVVGVVVGDETSTKGSSHGNTFRLKINPGPNTTALQVWASDNRYELDVLGCEGNGTVHCRAPNGLAAGVVSQPPPPTTPLHPTPTPTPTCAHMHTLWSDCNSWFILQVWEKTAQRNTLWPGLMQDVSESDRYVDRSDGSNRIL